MSQPLTEQQIDNYAILAITADHTGERIDPAVVTVLVDEVRKLQQQRRFLLGRLARKDARSGDGDRALREFLGGEPGPDAAVTRASRDAEVMRRCAEFVRDTYDGQWADDAAATLERDADVTEHGCPGYEDAGWGDTVAERQLANCKHCGRPRAVCVAAPASPVAPLAASQPSEAPVEGETGERAATGRVGDSLPAVAGTQPCGHDDYHDPHPWHERPDIWCPGIGYDDDQAATANQPQPAV